MTYIHKAALDQIDRDLAEGFPYRLAVINSAIHWNICSIDLRAAHEARAHRAEIMHRASMGFLMLAVFISPVLFHLFARG
jgi:hypothetical protein